MSAARAQELQEELNYLKTTRSDEVAEQIKVARGFGDLSENSEYDEAKNEQGKLYSRIAELEEILQHVVIVDESNAPTNVVTIGCKVSVVKSVPILNSVFAVSVLLTVASLMYWWMEWSRACRM